MYYYHYAVSVLLRRSTAELSVLFYCVVPSAVVSAFENS